MFAATAAGLPLPKGEGRGEGELGSPCFHGIRMSETDWLACELSFASSCAPIAETREPDVQSNPPRRHEGRRRSSNATQSTEYPRRAAPGAAYLAAGGGIIPVLQPSAGRSTPNQSAAPRPARRPGAARSRIRRAWARAESLGPVPPREGRRVLSRSSFGCMGAVGREATSRACRLPGLPPTAMPSPRSTTASASTRSSPRKLRTARRRCAGCGPTRRIMISTRIISAPGASRPGDIWWRCWAPRRSQRVRRTGRQ